MNQVRTVPAAICPQHHCPRAECPPDSRHTQPLRTSDTLMRKVEAKAAEQGKNRNEGIEAALEAWTDGVDEDAQPPLAVLLAEMRALREQVDRLSAGSEPEAPRKRKAPPAADGGDRAATIGQLRDKIKQAEARPGAAKVVRFVEPKA